MKQNRNPKVALGIILTLIAIVLSKRVPNLKADSPDRISSTTEPAIQHTPPPNRLPTEPMGIMGMPSPSARSGGVPAEYRIAHRYRQYKTPKGVQIPIEEMGSIYYINEDIIANAQPNDVIAISWNDETDRYGELKWAIATVLYYDENGEPKLRLEIHKRPEKWGERTHNIRVYSNHESQNNDFPWAATDKTYGTTYYNKEFVIQVEDSSLGFVHSAGKIYLDKTLKNLYTPTLTIKRLPTSGKTYYKEDLPVLVYVDNPSNSVATVKVDLRTPYRGDLTIEREVPPKFKGDILIEFPYEDFVKDSRRKVSWYYVYLKWQGKEVFYKNGEMNADIKRPEPDTPIIKPSTTGLTNKDIQVNITYPNIYDLTITQRQYRIDNGAWQNYTGAITLKNNATIQARQYSTTSGEWSSIATLKVTNIDKTKPPTPTLTLSTTAPTKSATLTIDYKDSTVTKQYKIGTGNWITYTQPLNITSNSTIYARSISRAGNISDTASRTISNIDNTPPTVTTQVIGKSLIDQKIKVNVNDNMGLKEVEVKHNNKLIKTYPISSPTELILEVDKTPNLKVDIIVRDKAGNQTTKTEIVNKILIDVKLPLTDMEVFFDTDKNYGETSQIEVINNGTPIKLKIKLEEKDNEVNLLDSKNLLETNRNNYLLQTRLVTLDNTSNNKEITYTQVGQTEEIKVDSNLKFVHRIYNSGITKHDLKRDFKFVYIVESWY